MVQNGISVEKQAASKLMTITLLSSDPKFDEIYLSNYATLNVLDMLRRDARRGQRLERRQPLLRHADMGACPTSWPTSGLTVKRSAERR